MSAIMQFDRLIASRVVDWHNPLFNWLMIIVANLFSPAILIILAVILAGWYYYKNKIDYALVLFFGVVGGWLLTEGLKLLIARPRPEGGLIGANGFSFPSAHAATSIIFFFIAAYLLREKAHKRFIKLLLLLFIIIVFLVGLSRIYLGAHWFSDVLGGYFIGYVWAVGVIIFGSYIKRN